MVVSRRRHGACSALRWSEVQGRYLCGMLSAPALAVHQPLLLRWPARLWIRLMRRWIAAGVGCDADVEVRDLCTGELSVGHMPPLHRLSKSTTHV